MFCSNIEILFFCLITSSVVFWCRFFALHHSFSVSVSVLLWAGHQEGHRTYRIYCSGSFQGFPSIILGRGLSSANHWKFVCSETK